MENDDIQQRTYSRSRYQSESAIPEIELLHNFTINHLQRINGKRELIEFAALIAISFVSVLSNARVFYIVTCTRRKCKSVSVLVAHLTAITIASNLHEILYFADKCEMVILRAPYICGTMSFVRNTPHALFPINVLAIIYERVRTFRVTEEKLLVCRTILLIWILGIVGTLPALWSYEFEPDSKFGHCKKVLSVKWRIAYELGRFLIFHILVCIFIGIVLYTIRSKLKYLYFLQPIPTEKTKRKVYRIRFVYLYSILFIVLWMAVGLLVFLCKVFPIIPGIVDVSTITIIRIAAAFKFLHYTFCILNPLIYICLNESMSAKYVLGCVCIKNFILGVNPTYTQNNRGDLQNEDENIENTNFEVSDMSRFPTLGISDQVIQSIDFVEMVDVKVPESAGTFV